VTTTSVPARKVHPLADLTEILARIPDPPDGGDWEQDDRFNVADPGLHNFRASTENDSTKNPKGYIERYRPQQKTRNVIRQVKQILAANADYLPMTCRQIFYRMVAEHNWPKSKDDELYDVLKNMRRARVIPFDVIRDDGIGSIHPGGFDGPEGFWRTVGQAAKDYRRHRQDGQDYRLELWCEAAGMLPQLGKVADPYGVPVYSCSGFNSLASVRAVVDRVLYNGDVHGVPTVVLHVGDFDPSGITVYNAFTEDVGRFVHADRHYRYRQELHAVRVALTIEQIESDQLVTNDFDREKAKRDKHPHVRGWKHDFTCQAEALPPARLAAIVEDAIVAWFDQDTYQDVLSKERPERQRITWRLPA
jgi:hypothetical protein